MVDEKLDDQVWVTVVATRYGDTPRRRQEPPIEEPRGEPRVERRPARVGGSEFEPVSREPVSVRRGAVSDLDVPEFLPRR
jgi:cell division protein FtsZ